MVEHGLLFLCFFDFSIVVAFKPKQSFLFFLFPVMDVTDIINGKVDDEDKQHFIPFQA